VHAYHSSQGHTSWHLTEVGVDQLWNIQQAMFISGDNHISVNQQDKK
jgi:hypothetical protein